MVDRDALLLIRKSRSATDPCLRSPLSLLKRVASLRPVRGNLATNRDASSQVLFDPAEKQFDGPSAAINLSDAQHVQGELIGDEGQRLAGFRIYSPATKWGARLIEAIARQNSCIGTSLT